MSELLPCPFCGNYKGDENNDAPHICFSVLRDAELAHCEVCGAEVHAHGKDPRVTWNTRPIEDGLRAELARLKDENHALDQINRDIQTASSHLDEVLAELARRDEIITRLIALGDALIADEAEFYLQEQAEH